MRAIARASATQLGARSGDSGALDGNRPARTTGC